MTNAPTSIASMIAPKPVNTTFAVITSSAIGFISNASMLYGINRLLNRSMAGQWNFRGSVKEHIWNAGLSGILGGLDGLEMYRRGTIINQHAGAVARYSSNPIIADEIALQLPPEQPRRSGVVEKGLLFTTIASSIGWLANSIPNPYSKTTRNLGITTALSGLGWVGARVVNTLGDIKTDTHQTAFAERVALEREAGRLSQKAR